jgi:hypothetical protein
VRAGDPASHVRLELPVFVAERVTERGFLVGDHEEVEAEPDDGAVFQDGGAAEDEALPYDECHDADVHRVSDVAIEAGDDEVARRCDRRWCAEALEGEAGEGVEEGWEAEEEAQGAEQAEWGESEEWGRHVPVAEGPGDPDGECAWGEDEEDR